MREEEITEVTVIQKRERKTGPSFWANAVTLVILCAIIVAVQLWSKNWIENKPAVENKPTPVVEEERGIVLEDLETEKPLVEAETVVVPKVEEKPEIRNPKSETKPKSRITKSKPKKRKTKTSKTVKRSAYAAPDPYTDGGALDLDRPENREAAKEVKALPPLPTERDRFIPFESE